MELSRRDVLRYGAATGASLMIPRLKGKKGGSQSDTGRSAADPLSLYGYEEGVDGQVIAADPDSGLAAVFGQPTFSAADAAHGAMGWLSSAANGGGRLLYSNADPAVSSGSVYLVPRSVPTGSPTTVVAFWSSTDASAAGARIRLTPDGRVDVTDALGVRQAASSPIWSAQQRVRLDWRQLWDSGTIALTVWAYVGSDGEGWRPRAVLQASFGSDSPTYTSLGQEGSRATIGFDTYRTYDVAAMPTPFAPLVGAVAVHTFDDGLNNKPVLVGQDGIVAVSGTPKYWANAAQHGTMGVLIPPGGGVLRYDVPYPPAHTGSLYVRVLTRTGGDSRIVTIQSGSSVLAQIKIARDGTLYISDPAGRMLSKSKSKSKAGHWARIDWQAVWDGMTLAIDARYFATNSESPDNYTEVSGSIPATATPDTLAVGTASDTWKVYIDTLRTYGDVAAWPDPFDPAERVRPPGLAAWSGDATQTTVEIAGYTNDTTSVGLMLAAVPDLTNATALPSAAPNPSGWNKWSITGLQPGTRYYHQMTDTGDDDGPTFIGAMSSFKTLQPVGVPCTIKIAVGSCGQTSPIDPSAFNDIADWGPDRTVHLGDFGYPNTLTKDVATHMANWSLNATDPSFQKIMAIGCMDYIISDHDDNGTGNSNMPNFNDPITMASISAWQQVIPARVEDTQSPPHGRYRAEVEGNVRFIKLDTRSIDKSDTTATPTDPRDPGSTMLGATQLAWLKGHIDAAVAAHQLIVLFTDPAWNGISPGPPIPVSYSDKWPSYIYERDLISDYAAAAGAQLFIVFGDSHGLQQDDGSHEKNGFASICCGPLDQELHMHYQDSYQFNYPDGIYDEGGPYRHAQQYQRLTISQDDGSPQITVVAEARDCSPVVDGTPKTVATLTKVYTP